MQHEQQFTGPNGITYPPTPTRTTRFWRKFFPWQVFRFFVLNLKIMRIIVGGHS